MWTMMIIDVNGLMQKTVYDLDERHVVFVADVFSDYFINSIVEQHNHQLSKAYENGLKDGAQIIRK